MSGARLRHALEHGTVVLDGGLATQLERAGHDLSTGLWSARLLQDDPGAIIAVHRAYLAAGAQVITTASYQASTEGFERAGLDALDAATAWARSVQLAREAQEAVGGTGRTWIAGSVGPYGAMLADGSEYTGSYTDPDWPGRADGGLTVAQLRAFHRPRLTALAEAGADVLACETVPCLAEAEALLEEVALLGVPAWLSLTTVTGPDGGVRTRRGEPVSPAFASARDVADVIAVGINCTEPDGVPAAVELAAEVSGKPVVVYPNSGERWDAVARRWRGVPAGVADPIGSAAIRAWVQNGARLVGGCCRIGPDGIRAIAATLAVP